MGALSPAEAITQSFYAWELRGRGWQLAEYPVSLEPPHRPFLLLPGEADIPARPLDDGKRPTFVSALIEGTQGLLKGFFNGTSDGEPEPEPFEEQEPFPALPRGGCVTLSIRLPPDFTSNLVAAEQLLIALSSTLHPVSFEWIGAAGTVSLQITCDEADASRVISAVEGYAPGATVLEDEDRLNACWRDEQPHAIVDIGLENEFFLPLANARSFSVDPYITLVSALAHAGRGECAVLQVLFERVRNPWGRTIHDALGDGDGGCIFSDAPQFLSLAGEKTAAPFFAVVLRVGASAYDETRVRTLLRGAGSFLLQFQRPESNELVPLTSDGYWEGAQEWALMQRGSFRTGMLLAARELVGLVHLPDASVASSALLREAKRTKALPDVARRDGLVLGLNSDRGVVATASLDEEARYAHTWIIGASGTGKSSLLLNLILQDIEQGAGVAVLDPHGDLIDDIAARILEERLDDVVLFDPSDVEWPVGFNILSAKSDIERNLLSSDLVSIFQRFATTWGDTMSTVLGNAVHAILAHPEGGTLLELRRFLVEERFRKEYLGAIDDEELRFFWEKEYPLIGSRSIGPLLSRLDAFLRSRIIRHIVGQRDGKLDLGRVMESGKVFLAKLSKGLIGEEHAYLLGSLLVAKLNQLGVARQRTARAVRRPFWLYADECQHFTSPSMESLLAEGRKYRIGLTLAHQTLAQLADIPKLESALFGNAYTRIVFRVGEGDARKFAEGCSYFEAEDLTRLGRGEAIVRIGGASNDFNLKTLPIEAVEEADAQERREALVELSRATYAVPIDVVRAQLRVGYETAATTIKERRDEQQAAEPIPPPAVGASPPAVSSSPERTKGTRRIEAPEPAPLGRGGREHKYLQHLVKRLAEERGFRALIEDSAGDGRADVVLKKDKLAIACEISITTDVEHELANLRKCLEAGFARILFISPEHKRREKIAARLKKELPDAPIAVVSPEEIVGALEAIDAGPATTETTVRGYKVKVTRQTLSPNELAGRRSAVAEVIARTLKHPKDKC